MYAFQRRRRGISEPVSIDLRSLLGSRSAGSATKIVLDRVGHGLDHPSKHRLKIVVDTTSRFHRSARGGIKNCKVVEVLEDVIKLSRLNSGLSGRGVIRLRALRLRNTRGHSRHRKLIMFEVIVGPSFRGSSRVGR